MKLSLAIAQTLKAHGIGHVFVVSGGASLHLIHGIADTEGIEYVCTQHEQAGGFAADSYARFTGIGCALATSGPGATNLITAIATSYYDSVPVLYLTGQTATFRLDNKGTRQIGFQATPIVPMVSGITKYAVTPLKAEDVIPAIERAIDEARGGRPGPVLVDICDDLQRAEVTLPEKVRDLRTCY